MMTLLVVHTKDYDELVRLLGLPSAMPYDGEEAVYRFISREDATECAERLPSTDTFEIV